MDLDLGLLDFHVYLNEKRFYVFDPRAIPNWSIDISFIFSNLLDWKTVSRGTEYIK